MTARYITFDGIDITADGTLIYGYWLANGADNCTVQNATITMPYDSSTNYAIYANTGSNAPSILNNTIASNTYYGIRIYGTSTVPILNALVQGNVISGIRNYGIYNYYAENSVIADNTVACADANTVAFYGIYLYGVTSSTASVYGNEISGGSTASTVYPIRQHGSYAITATRSTISVTAAAATIVCGIYVSTGGPIRSNNMVSDLRSPGGTSTPQVRHSYYQ